MELLLEEIGTAKNSTASTLSIDGRPFCFVIEDGYRPTKVSGETRIPDGRYQILAAKQGRFFEKYNKKWGHEFVPYLQSVPGFTGILIHIGNTPGDTRGCLLVNNGIRIDKTEYTGFDSTTAYKLLYGLMYLAMERGEKIYIEITRKPLRKAIA